MATDSSSSHATRVWIQASAIDAIRNPPKPSRLIKSSSSSVVSESGNNNASSLSSSSDNISLRKEWSWKPALLMSSTHDKITIQDNEGTLSLSAKALEDGTILVDNEFPTRDNGIPQCPHDLITLTHLHEPAVVHCLNVRYQQDIIYTATGPVLLALNPFKTCRGLYSESTMKKYWERSERNLQVELPPHVYAIADQSFRSMMRLIDESLGSTETQKCDQSILVSGESGAGKTVTTKFVMKYLAALSQRCSLEKPKRAYQKVQQQRSGLSPTSLSTTTTTTTPQYSWAVNSPSIMQTMSGGPESPTSSNFQPNSIESQVLQSNPILESFGNARTLRNDNSSRFGKFIQIQFTASGKLVGATIETYLLEKVRLIHQAAGERNYHVFFEVLAGMPSSELREYCLASTATPHDFKMTCSGTYDRRDGVSDKDTYKALRSAMNTMKFPPAEQAQVFGIAVALLHASNLTFCETHGNDEYAILESDNVHLEPVCLLLGVTPEDLNDALCSFSITAGRDGHVRRKMTRAQAEKGLEALIKATYGALFLYLVGKINDSIAWKDPSLLGDSEEEEEEEEIPVDEFHRPAASIGVLDIFGFETFLVNSFEQLCINYCNEALQQQFNAFVLKNEQEEYEREGIDWSFIEFPENQDVLDLIDKRGSGILNILDDQCRAPGTTDRSFASDVYSKCTSLERFTASRKQVAALQFEVQHYAGPVEYTTEGFVEKNRDELPKESTELLRGSANPFAQHLADIIVDPESITSRFDTSTPPLPEDNAPMTPYKLSRTDSSVAARMTVGGQFRRQLRHLRSKIDQTCPHYIRCLKPNDNLVPDHFDEMVVAEQLRCGGILEAVRVTRAGFTQHYPHADFVRRYRSLAAKELDSGVSSNSSNGVRNSWHGGGTSSSNGTASWNSGGWKGGSKSWNGTTSGPSTPRNGGYRGSYGGYTGNSASSMSSSQEPEESAKSKCNKLLKVIYRKMQQYEKEEKKENVPDDGSASEADSSVSNSPAPVKSKTYNVASTPPPSWSKAAKTFTPSTPTNNSSSPLPPTPKTVPAKTKYPSWVKNQPAESSSPAPTPPPTYRSSGSFRRGMVSGSDLAKVGIQMGKTKVFLRHKAFETLERIRSREHTAAATKLNAIFRRYLARVAYIPIRDAYREEVQDHFSFLKSKSKDDRPETPSTTTLSRGSSDYASALIEKWESAVIRSIHNPIPRSEWGKDAPVRSFKWMLVDGIWAKNPDAVQDETS